MKNGLNRIDQRSAAQLTELGWTPKQISQRLRVKIEVIERWAKDLTPEGWAAYRASTQRERQLAATDVKAISEKDALAMAREQLLIEEKIRAEVRAEMALEKSAKPDAKPKEPEAEKDVTESAASQDDEPEAVAEAPVEKPPARRRRTRKKPEVTAEDTP